METIIKDSKPFPFRMLSFICIIFPLIAKLIAPAFKCDIDSFTIFTLLACAEMMILPPVMDSLTTLFYPVFLFILVTSSALLLQSILWPILIIVIFVLSVVLRSEDEMCPGKLKRIVYQLVCLVMISLVSFMALSGQVVLASIAAFLSLAIYIFMSIILLKSISLSLPCLRNIEDLAFEEEHADAIRYRGRHTDYSYDLEEMKELMERVDAVMRTDKPYLSESYCLMDMAATVYTNKTYLSKTINLLTGKNFRQYINSYRIEYAVKLMQDDHRLRVAELSVLAGFHSAVTFGMAFKLNMGETPGEYLQKLKAGLE